MEVFSKTESQEKFFNQFLFLTVLFFLVRIPYLTQEYGYEEALWVDGGLRLLNFGKLEFNWGLTAPAITGFHKPPLFHLLMGLAGKVFGENEVSYRMIPLLFSYVGFYFGARMVYLLKGSVLLFGFTFITLPFFFLGNNQVNVDGSLVMCAYTYLLWLMMDIFKDRHALSRKQQILLAVTVSLLYWIRGLGLFFAFCVLAAALLYRFLFQDRKIYQQDKDIIKCFLLGSLGGALFMTIMSLWAKGNLQGWVDWYLWNVGQKQGFSSRAGSLWAWFVRVFDFIGVIQRKGVIWYLLIPAVLLVLAIKEGWKKFDKVQIPIPVLFFIFIMIPTGFYLAAGANPYGFPRYFIPSMMVGVIATCTPIFGKKSYKFFCWILFLSSIFHSYKIYTFYQDRVARTEWKGQKGFKQAAQYLKQVLPENSKIVAMSSAGYYYGENYIDSEAISYQSPEQIKTYFEQHAIKAWVFQPTEEGDFHKENVLFPYFNQRLQESKNTIIKTIGTLKVYIFDCQEMCGG